MQNCYMAIYYTCYPTKKEVTEGEKTKYEGGPCFFCLGYLLCLLEGFRVHEKS